MGNYKNILVAIDLYDHYEVVLEQAVFLAKFYKAKLNVVHVMPYMVSSLPYSYDFQVEVEKDVKKKLQTIKDELAYDKITLHQEHGVPKREIIDLAKKIKADLLILGSHGKHGVELLLGSTSNGVLHMSDIDVLTVRLQEKKTKTATKKYKNILLATDLQADSEKVADMATKMAASFGAQIHAINVVPNTVLASGAYIPNFEIEVLDQAKKAMEQLAHDKKIAKNNINIAMGNAKTEILAYAKKIGADLIVVGSHGRKLLASVVLGATANAVLHGATDDVFVVRI